MHINAPTWKVQLDSGRHSLLEPHETAFLKEKLHIPASNRPNRVEMSPRMEWRYFLRRETGKGAQKKRIVQVGRKTRVGSRGSKA